MVEDKARMSGPRKRRLIFIEPSKVDKYHITLIDGYIRSLVQSPAITSAFDVSVEVCASTRANLSPEVRDVIHWRPIPVIHQEKHQVVQKSLLEFLVVARVMFGLRTCDMALVSCIMPTALVLLELMNRLLRRRGLYVVVHGEIEGFVQQRKEHWRGIGYWSQIWMRVRPKNSRINIVVIDDFIRAALVSAGGKKFDGHPVAVVHHPVTGIATREEPHPEPSVCFVGFRALSKGFAVFEQLPARHPDILFLAIGQGRVQNVSTGSQAPLSGGSQSFLNAIASCSAALFPYTTDYCCTLSAAALDTLSAGVHIIATDRPFFVSLADYFGPDFVTIYCSQEELDTYLSRPRWLAEKQAGRPERLAALAKSKYSLASVQKELESLFLQEVRS